MWATRDDDTGDYEYTVWRDEAKASLQTVDGIWGSDVPNDQDDGDVEYFSDAQWQAMPDAPQLDKGGGPVEVELIVRAKLGNSLRDTITRACNDATKGDK